MVSLWIAEVRGLDCWATMLHPGWGLVTCEGLDAAGLLENPRLAAQSAHCLAKNLDDELAINMDHIFACV